MPPGGANNPRRAVPFGSVLLPTDFSGGAEAALHRALRLPLGRAARLHVIHVQQADLPARLRSRAEDLARAALEQAASRARNALKRSGRKINMSCEILRGEAFVEIIRYARRMESELVVLGRHGHRPIRDRFIGTTAARVIRHGDTPVLVVNSEPTHSYRRPLVATDLSDASRRTLELTLRVVGRDADEIGVVHAFHVAFEGLASAGFAVPDHYRRQCLDKATKGLSEILEPFRHLKLRWRKLILKGEPRSAVLGAALRRRADLVAVGTHGRSGVARALLGSVAEWITSAAPCDVLVARPIRFSFKEP